MSIIMNIIIITRTANRLFSNFRVTKKIKNKNTELLQIFSLCKNISIDSQTMAEK